MNIKQHNTEPKLGEARRVLAFILILNEDKNTQ